MWHHHGSDIGLYYKVIQILIWKHLIKISEYFQKFRLEQKQFVGPPRQARGQKSNFYQRHLKPQLKCLKKIWKKSKIRPRLERSKKDRNISKCLEMS